MDFVELLKALGYPASSIIVLVVLAYIGRNFFEKILRSITAEHLEALKQRNRESLEVVKKEYRLVLEDRKAELVKETERLKSMLSVEAETYRLAAQKRFESLFALWQSSESLFKDTNFSKLDSIKTSIEKVGAAVENLNQYSVLFSPKLYEQIKTYLERVAEVFTNSEKNYEEHTVSSDKVSALVDIFYATEGGRFPPEPVSPKPKGKENLAEILPNFGDIVIRSMGMKLERLRFEAALEARNNFSEVIRTEFGIWVSERKPLGNLSADNLKSV